MKTPYLTFLLSIFSLFSVSAQLPPECQLDFGVNMAGMADFGTELPFVDLMHNAREWYTKDVGNPSAPFDSEHATHLTYRPDGYPTHIPQSISESPFPQEAVTIWGDTRGWPAGQYTLLWEGTGTLRLFGSFSNLTTTGPHRITFDLTPQEQGIVELAIETSDISDPIHNIRLLMPGTEATYESQPFNSTWLDKLEPFGTIRFMDWGQTNNWGKARGEDWNNPAEFDWEERSQMDHYTWAYEKGIPYEMMVKLMNDYDLDGWVCVPHRASPEYSQQMAEFFRDHLAPERHLYVEYSNEIWNWIFDQTLWLNFYGCEQTGTTWPEGLVPYIQRCLDAFTTAYAGDLQRITRVVGTQLSWVDVSQRIVNNLTPGSFDAISPTCYFGFTDEAEAALDQLGATATVADVAERAAESLPLSFSYVKEQQVEVADPLGVPMLFYEGGQHLTPHPFGVYPDYGEALVDLQRSPQMYDLYNTWFDSLRTLQSGEVPLKIMHFSFVAPRSAQFGSWGMLETMEQDINQVPAPKYTAILENLADPNCETTLSVDWQDFSISEQNCAAEVNWSTSAETDNTYFEVWRSQESEPFTLATRIPGNMTTGQSSTYRYTDKYLAAGNYIYRIDQVDLDESRSSAGLFRVAVTCQDGTMALRAFPNPTDNQLIFSTSIVSDGNVELMDGVGKVVRQAYLPQLSGSSINVADLPPGLYTAKVEVITTGKTIALRVVKH